MEKGGMWLFCQKAFTIEKYDGLVDPESVDLNSVGVWMQIYKLPPGYRKKNFDHKSDREEGWYIF
jgi:hypothetical protein